MPTSIITTDDLREFKLEFLEEFKAILHKKRQNNQKRYLKSAEESSNFSIKIEINEDRSKE